MGHPIPLLSKNENPRFFLGSDPVINAEGGEELGGLGGGLDRTDGEGVPKSALQLDPGVEDSVGVGAFGHLRMNP